MTNAKTIRKNLFSLSAAQVTTTVIGLITTAYLARVIEPQGFGIIGFAGAFVSYFGLIVNLGFDTLGTREIAKNRTLVSKYVNNIITIRIIMAILGYTIFAAVVYILNKPSLVKNVLYITGFGLFANALLLNWVFQGIENMEIIALRQILTSLMSLMGIVLLVHKPSDVILAVSVSVLSNVVNTSWMTFVYVNHFGRIRIDFNFTFWREIFRSALPMAFSIFMIMVYYNMDMVMLGFMRTETEVGYYSAAYKVLLISLIPASIILKAFFPQLSIAHGNKDRMFLLMKKYSIAMFIVGAFLSMMGIAFANQIVTIIFGSEFHQSVFLLQILMIDTVLVYINMTYGNPLLAWNKETVYMYAIIAGGVGNIILNLILIPRYGATGAAVGTVFSEALVLVGLSYLHFKVSRSLYLGNLRKVLFSSGISLVIAYLMQNFDINFVIVGFSTVFIFCFFNFILRTVSLRELRGYFIR